jgi:hypothetical protein
MSLISVSNVKNLQPYVQFFVNPNVVFGVSWNFVRKVTTAARSTDRSARSLRQGIRPRSTSRRSVKSI